MKLVKDCKRCGLPLMKDEPECEWIYWDWCVYKDG